MKTDRQSKTQISKPCTAASTVSTGSENGKVKITYRGREDWNVDFQLKPLNPDFEKATRGRPCLFHSDICQTRSDKLIEVM